MKQSDFLAHLKFQKTEEGGRTNCAVSGYRPHIEFDNYPEYLTSGSHTYLNKEKVFPGESVEAEIKIIGVDYFTKRLFKGKQFKFCEGRRIMGYGEITKITNKDLEIENGDKEESFNINLFPKDILKKIDEDFKEDVDHAKKAIQPYLLNQIELRGPRIVRSLIFLSNGQIDELGKQIEIAKLDYRDTFLMAEYEGINTGHPKRVRNFDKEFGSEKI